MYELYCNVKIDLHIIIDLHFLCISQKKTIEFIEYIVVCRALYGVIYLLSLYIEWCDFNGIVWHTAISPLFV